MNISILFATIMVIFGLIAASKLQQPYKRRVRNLFLIALVLTFGGCIGLVKHIDSTTNGLAPDLWSNSLIWVLLFALGIVVFTTASVVSFYLNVKQRK
ncbi:MAG: hypothetical protein AAF304_01570 [Pseudomonadota bacterium]